MPLDKKRQLSMKTKMELLREGYSLWDIFAFEHGMGEEHKELSCEESSQKTKDTKVKSK